MKKLWLILAFAPFLFVSCDVLGDLLGDIKDEIEQEGGNNYDDGDKEDNVGTDVPVVDNRQNVVVLEEIEGPLSPFATDFTIVVASDKPLDPEFFMGPNIVDVELTEKPDAATEWLPYVYNMKVTFEVDEYDDMIILRLGRDEHYIVQILPKPYIQSLPYHSVGVAGGIISEYHVYFLQEHYEKLGYYDYKEVYWSETEGVICPELDEWGNYSPLEIGVNPTTSEREIVICAGLRDSGGNVIKVAEYVVTQEGGVVMELPSTTFVAPFNGAQIEIPINSNVDFEVSISNWWVTVLEQTPSRLKLNIEGYHGEAQRYVTVTLTNTANNFVEEIKIIQFPHAITTVHLDEPGTLSNKFSMNEMLDLLYLQITGEMNESDFQTLKKFTTLEFIDISGVKLQDNTLPELAFDDMLLETIILPTKLQKIGRMAFAENPMLESIDIPAGVTDMGETTFYGCSSLKSIKLPKGIKMIGDAMFSGCSSLTEIDIPEGVEEIGSAAFRNCTSLQRVGIPSSLQRFAFGTDSYNYDYGYQFYGCKSLKEISFPSRVNYIPTYCFAECDLLESITLNNVETIRSSAFENCKSLKEVSMSRVTSIYNSAFRGCTSLETVNCPIINNIGYSAFSGCSALKEFTFPKTLKSINSYTFSDCVSLSRIEIPKSVTEIGNGAFSGCTGLTAAYVNATILTLSESMFANCTNLLYLELPEKLQTVEKGAFYYVHSLLVLKLNSTSTTPLTGEGLSSLQRFRIDLLVPTIISGEINYTVVQAYEKDEFWSQCRKINDTNTKTPDDLSWDDYVKNRDFWDDFIQEEGETF